MTDIAMSMAQEQIRELRAENERLTAALDFMEKRAVRKEAEIERQRLRIKDLEINSPAQAALDEIERHRNDYSILKRDHDSLRDQLQTCRELREYDRKELNALKRNPA